MKISQRTITEICNVPVAEIVVSFIGEPKRKDRSNWWWNSPFSATDRTPSFAVRVDGLGSDKTGVWKCFSSGEGGVGGISFAKALLSVGFRDAVFAICSQLGIKVEYEDDGRVTYESASFEVLRDYAEFYYSRIAEDRMAMEYLGRRRVSTAAIDRFRLGACPYTDPCLHQVNELVEADILRGQRPTFAGRITFPFRNAAGRVVGIYGRDYTGSSQKHINTRGIDVFKKGSTFFGLHENATSIRKQREVVICEGQMDVVGLWEGKVDTGIAIGSSGISDDQAKIISRLGADRVIIAFEGDTYAAERGKMSKLMKAVQQLMVHGVIPSVMFMKPFRPGDKAKIDPDLIRFHPDGARGYMDKMTFPVHEFAYKQFKGQANPTGKLAVLSGWIKAFCHHGNDIAKFAVMDSFVPLLKGLGVGDPDIAKMSAGYVKPKAEPGPASYKGTAEYTLLHYVAHNPDQWEWVHDGIRYGTSDSAIIEIPGYAFQAHTLERLREYLFRSNVPHEKIGQEADVASIYSELVVTALPINVGVEQVDMIIDQVRRVLIDERATEAHAKGMELLESGQSARAAEMIELSDRLKREK